MRQEIEFGRWKRGVDRIGERVDANLGVGRNIAAECRTDVHTGTFRSMFSWNFTFQGGGYGTGGGGCVVSSPFGSVRRSQPLHYNHHQRRRRTSCKMSAITRNLPSFIRAPIIGIIGTVRIFSYHSRAHKYLFSSLSAPEMLRVIS